MHSDLLIPREYTLLISGEEYAMIFWFPQKKDISVKEKKDWSPEENLNCVHWFFKKDDLRDHIVMGCQTIV